MKKKILFIILCILFIPFVVNAEDSYVFEKYDINIMVDEGNKQLIVNEKIITGDIDEELTIGRGYTRSLATENSVLKEFPSKLKSNTEYNYSYVIDSSNGIANFKFLNFYEALIDDNNQLIELRNYSFKFKKVNINISNTNEDDIKKVSVNENNLFSYQKYDKYIKMTSIGELKSVEFSDNQILFEKDFREDPIEPEKELSSFELIPYILGGLIIVSTVYLIIITRSSKIKPDELDIDSDIKKWYETKISGYDTECFGIGMSIIIAAYTLPLLIPNLIKTFKGLDTKDMFYDMEQFLNPLNIIVVFILSITGIILISRCVYHTRLILLNKKIKTAKIMRVTSYNMTKKINENSADTYTITAYLDGKKYKTSGTYNRYLNYSDPHIVLYGKNKWDIYFKQ